MKKLNDNNIIYECERMTCRGDCIPHSSVRVLVEHMNEIIDTVNKLEAKIKRLKGGTNATSVVRKATLLKP